MERDAEPNLQLTSKRNSKPKQSNLSVFDGINYFALSDICRWHNYYTVYQHRKCGKSRDDIISQIESPVISTKLRTWLAVRTSTARIDFLTLRHRLSKHLKH